MRQVLRKFPLFGPVAVVLLMAVNLWMPSLVVNAYSCSGSSHCYNVKSWSGLTPGAQTDIYPSTNFYGGGDSSGMYNEEWLDDDQTYGCQHNVAGQCWIEAGFQVQPAFCGNVPTFTWSDITLYDNMIHIHDFCTVAFNSWTTVTIDQTSTPTSWDVKFDNDANNVHLAAQSTNNGMNPDRIDIGSELFGTYGAHSDQFSWARNSYGGANQTFYLQFSDGYGLPNNPPSGGWVTPPSQSPGGYFYSTCC